MPSRTIGAAPDAPSIPVAPRRTQRALARFYLAFGAYRAAGCYDHERDARLQQTAADLDQVLDTEFDDRWDTPAWNADFAEQLRAGRAAIAHARQLVIRDFEDAVAAVRRPLDYSERYAHPKAKPSTPREWGQLAVGRGYTHDARRRAVQRLAGHLLNLGADPQLAGELVVAWDREHNSPPLGRRDAEAAVVWVIEQHTRELEGRRT